MKRVLLLVGVGVLLAAVLFVANTVATPAPTAHAAATHTCTSQDVYVYVWVGLPFPVGLCQTPGAAWEYSGIYQICASSVYTANVQNVNTGTVTQITNTCVQYDPGNVIGGGITAWVTVVPTP